MPKLPSLVDELVYVDDTLLVGVNARMVQSLMTHIGNEGGSVGLSFNWSKLEALTVRMAAEIPCPDGNIIVEKDSILYLGSPLAYEGRAGSELGRRIGLAQCDFRSLQRVWAHSSLSRAAKVRVFEACIILKLCYSLEVATLNTAEIRRLNGFQARCLRRILGIPAAFISRVSNKAVLAKANSFALSHSVVRQQLIFLGELTRRAGDDPVRVSVFQPGSIALKSLSGTRRVGRPRNTWPTLVLQAARQVAGDRLEVLLSDRSQWNAVVQRHICSLYV